MIEIANSRNPLDRISETADNLRYLAAINTEGVAIFKNSKFAEPFSIIPLALLGYSKRLTFENIPDYFTSIGFPAGQEICDFMNSERNLVPLIRADLIGLTKVHREKKLRELSDKYANLVSGNIIKDDTFVNRIGNNVSHLLISEMMDNILEHSESNHTFILSHYFNEAESCEICIADDGIGIFKSLLNANRNVKNDLDAIQKVITEALSAKDEFGSTKRGTGIRNTINLLSNDELNGFFCIISGRAGYFINNKYGNKFINFKNFYWQGTIVNFGFEKPQKNINIYEFVR